MLSGDHGLKLISSTKTVSYGKIPTKLTKLKEVIVEPEILDAIITTFHFLGHDGQDATTKIIGQSYYDVSCKEVVLLVKLCEICHKQTHSKSKGLLVSIISTKLYERIQIDLIDMQSTPDITTTVIYK